MEEAKLDKPAAAAAPTIMPSAAAAEVALRASMVLMAPLARWLMRNGVQYGAFTSALKRVFIRVAGEELESSGRKITDSALSVLSGVHRKDVRALTAEAPPSNGLKTVSPVSQLFTRWVSDSRYRDGAGRPKALLRIGSEPSFESLAREISTDVHPRTLLDELVRLGMARTEGEMVVLLSEAFVPSSDHAELANLFAANGADHLAAAVHNLTTRGPRFLEQSVFADGLSEEAVRELGEVARTIWAEAFQRMVAEAQARVEAHRRLQASHPALPDSAEANRALNGQATARRMRFGVYFYSEPEPQGE